MLNIYRASAGSGKTFQLTKDYIFLLFNALGNNPRPHRRILAVTFTNKATDEMKSRILKELHALSSGSKSEYRDDLIKKFKLTENEVNQRAGKILIQILHDYSSFSISTIDKFFQQVVRSFAREIGINGGYNIELDQVLTLQQALDNMYRELSEKENEQLLIWMTDFLQEQIEDGKTWRVDKDIMKFGKQIFEENYQHKVLEIKEKLQDKRFLAQYRKKLRQIKTDFEKEINSEVEKIYRILKENDLTGEEFKGNYLLGGLKKIYSDKIYDLSKSITNYSEDVSNCIANPKKNPYTAQITNAYFSGVQEGLNRIIFLITDSIIPYNTANIILQNISTLGILSDLADQVNKLTAEQNIMLLSDTNMLLNKIIDDSETPFVYERTGMNIDHYMIDEFQDTSVLQWKNFKPLIANSLATNNKNMVVGDVKQSIYRWRNSDWKLLDRQVNEDFSSGQIIQKTLGTNWRSDRNIIQFNNSFFRIASQILQEKLNTNLGTATDNYPELKHFNEIISHAYSDIEQNVSKNASEGFVKIEFIEKKSQKTDRTQLVLEKIPALLEGLVDRGYKPNDIAFIVRFNNEATELINFLLAYKKSPEARPGFSYEVVGSEGIMLTASSSVNFIIAVLKLIFNPKDDVSRTIMQYEYQIGKMKKTEDEAVRSCFSEEGKNSAQSALFTEDENKCIDEISRMALFEATEKLISTFGIEKWHDETVFLQAFQDEVFKFVNNSNADLNSFLNWWDENGEKLNIDAPENENAFRVITIHKAKGLDFKTVIIPFCNWELDSSRKPLLWCETTIEPFNELPLMPAQYSSKLVNTIFQKEYFEEQMHQYVDNLNLAYVAFTRARNDMIIFADDPSDKISKMPDLLFKSLSENSELNEFWNEDRTVLEIGSPTEAVYKQKKVESTTKKLSGYPITDSSERLKIRHTSKDYWKEAPISENRVNYGTIMHEILQKTFRRGDEQKAIAEQISSGRITDAELTIIHEELNRFWSLPEANEWFSADAEVLNECAILLPSGEMYRPDRVLLKDNAATVVDYKFGEEEHGYHKRQIQRYADFLHEMGYKEVKGLLYYVSLGKIISLTI